MKKCNVGIDFLSGRINTMMDDTPYSRARSQINSKTAVGKDRPFTASIISNFTPSRLSNGGSPNLLKIGSGDSPYSIRKQNVIADFTKFSQQGPVSSGFTHPVTGFTKVVRKPPIVDTGKREVEKHLKGLTRNESGNTVHGRILNSPSMGKLLKSNIIDN